MFVNVKDRSETRGTDAQLKGLASIATLKIRELFLSRLSTRDVSLSKTTARIIVHIHLKFFYFFLLKEKHCRILYLTKKQKRRRSEKYNFPPVRRFQYILLHDNQRRRIQETKDALLI